MPKLERNSNTEQRGRAFRLPRDGQVITPLGKRLRLAVNAAIHLRRPLLVTGSPGTGKTSIIRTLASARCSITAAAKATITTLSTREIASRPASPMSNLRGQSILKIWTFTALANRFELAFTTSSNYAVIF